MGQVDSTLKYGIYHSYQLMPNDWVYATIFDVQYLSHITAQCVVIKPAGDITEGRFEVRWIDAEGAPIGGTSKKGFTPTRLWKRHTATFQVPENAIKARVHFEGGTQGYHFACAMVEPGEIASAFSFEVASRLVYITNEGAYLGLLNAGQIVTGKMLSPTGMMWVDLDKPEIVMKGVDADLYIDPANPIKVVDKDNNFIGGIMNIDNEVKFVAGALTNMENANSFAKIGTMPNPEDPDVMDEGILFYVNLAAPGDPPIYAPSFYIRADGGNLGNVVDLGLYGKECGVSVYQVSPDYPAVSLWAKNSLLKVWRDQIELIIEDPVTHDQSMLLIDNVEGEMFISTANGTIGTDQSGGPYVIRKNGTKVYL